MHERVCPSVCVCYRRPAGRLFPSSSVHSCILYSATENTKKVQGFLKGSLFSVHFSNRWKNTKCIHAVAVARSNHAVRVTKTTSEKKKEVFFSIRSRNNKNNQVVQLILDAELLLLRLLLLLMLLLSLLFHSAASIYSWCAGPRLFQEEFYDYYRSKAAELNTRKIEEEEEEEKNAHGETRRATQKRKKKGGREVDSQKRIRRRPRAELFSSSIPYNICRR